MERGEQPYPPDFDDVGETFDLETFEVVTVVANNERPFDDDMDTDALPWWQSDESDFEAIRAASMFVQDARF